MTAVAVAQAAAPVMIAVATPAAAEVAAACFTASSAVAVSVATAIPAAIAIQETAASVVTTARTAGHGFWRRSTSSFMNSAHRIAAVGGGARISVSSAA